MPSDGKSSLGLLPGELKKTLPKQINNKLFIPIHMETPYLAPLGLFFLLWISDEEENMTFVEDHPMKIPIKFGSNWSSGFIED